jgi:hypothetical protein
MIVTIPTRRPAMGAALAASLALLGLTASGLGADAAAQTYGYGQTYGQGYGQSHGRYRQPSYADQYDRPGDFRCDAYWDAGRSDCHEGWRDQRRGVRYGHNLSWRGQTSHHGYGYGYGSGYGQGYGQGYGGAYGHGGATAYHGAYGRPDLVYGGGNPGHGAAAGRDAARVDWCRWNYRSYNPATGYYLAYSGQYVFCG